MYAAKSEVVVHDNIDTPAPMLARMADKRMTGYRSLGYKISDGLAPFVVGSG